MSKLSDETKEAIITSYKQGSDTIKEIAKTNSISVPYIYTILKEKGVEKNRSTGRPVSRKNVVSDKPKLSEIHTLLTQILKKVTIIENKIDSFNKD